LRLRSRDRQYRSRLGVFGGCNRDGGPLTSEPRPDGRGSRGNGRAKLAGIVAIGAGIIIAAASAVLIGFGGSTVSEKPADPATHSKAALPHRPTTYLGVYAPGVPQSYAGVSAFTAATGVTPGIVLYYSGWPEPFQLRFAAMAARHDAVPLVQIDPTDISLTAIASGHYDSYLRSYASAVKAFGGRVIIGFGHEVNGYWYSWGYRHTSPAAFVAAWRHIVTVFRRQGADNVTWLWTINIIHGRGGIPPPARWWPGASYVTWVGIDGYYRKPSWTFASTFGPTIKAVRELTLAPILIAETSVAPKVGQSAKIANLFAGIRAYGLLGFVWFDANGSQDWRLSGPAAVAAFRRGARAYRRPAP
jgi:mannan endo-1,4-beta-mannosidase